MCPYHKYSLKIGQGFSCWDTRHWFLAWSMDMFGTLLVMADFATVFISPVIFSSKRGSVCVMCLIRP